MSSSDRSEKLRLLIADDQPDVLDSLHLLLKSEGFEIEATSTPDGILQKVEDKQFDALLIDLNYTRDTTSGAEGLELLSRLKELDETLPVVVMTAWGSVDVVVEAMKRGARDFIEKPWDNARLLSVVRTQCDLARALRRERRLQAENRILQGEGAVEFIAESEVMKPVLELIRRVAPSDANVLLTGENGTGKSLVARLLHSGSGRRGKSMVTVNIGGLPEGVFESELFGHVKGAYTDAKGDRVGRFELADQGTLFLDEIATISAAQQAKLLRVLETGEFERVGSSRTTRVDVRVISATNSDLSAEVVEGRFRQDLYFRLNTVEISLPPLRRRQEDIPLLADVLLDRYCRKYGKRLQGLTGRAAQSLREYHWPGNIRELDHAIERAVLMTTADRIEAPDLGLRPPARGERSLEDLSLEEVEEALIRKALSRCDGNVSHAAKALGLSRSALYRRINKLNL